MKPQVRALRGREGPGFQGGVTWVTSEGLWRSDLRRCPGFQEPGKFSEKVSVHLDSPGLLSLDDFWRDAACLVRVGAGSYRTTRPNRTYGLRKRKVHCCNLLPAGVEKRTVGVPGDLLHRGGGYAYSRVGRVPGARKGSGCALKRRADQHVSISSHVCPIRWDVVHTHTKKRESRRVGVFVSYEGMSAALSRSRNAYRSGHRCRSERCPECPNRRLTRL